MWDNPLVLNRIANLLGGLAVVLIFYFLFRFVTAQPIFAVHHMRLINTLEHVTMEQVETIAKRDMKGTFFTMDLRRMRDSFEKLPWVRRVDIRRGWPDRIEVDITEQQPIARWGNSGLVNRQGEVFEAAYDTALPVFIAPEGTSREVSVQYDWLRKEFSNVGRAPVLVRLSQRRDWQVKLDDGMTIEVGRENVEKRLIRFLADYHATLSFLKRKVSYIDLRYANGFAVRVADLSNTIAKTASDHASAVRLKESRP